ncbi:sensor histidine kinase [Cohnella suwonensis]|uniref:histidine kinase n=1 Tax=Cohnella suwonensis TaxID=696072 RepID=A0ABW0LY27_9BACL
MRIGIVPKLFLLTIALCSTILAVIYVGQTIFFKDYYANRKVNDIKANIAAFEQQPVAGNVTASSVRQREQEFYRNNNTWITTLDRHGNLARSDDFYLDFIPQNVDPKPDAPYRIPLYHLIGSDKIEEAKSLIAPKSKAYLSVVMDEGVPVTPVYVQDASSRTMWSNDLLSKRVEEINIRIKEEYVQYEKNLKEIRKKAAEAALEQKESSLNATPTVKVDQREFVKIEPQPTLEPSLDFVVDIEQPAEYDIGVIVDAVFPDPNGTSNLLYSNRLFLERIKQFQEELLFGEERTDDGLLHTTDYEESGVKYKLFVHRIVGGDGAPSYIFAMASLQPVDEAVSMIQDYYVYIVLFVVVLVLLASLYYSLKIARPLLRINRTAKKIADLDFTESLPVRSKDEIGELSRSINSLSATLHGYIGQLRQDIEKEKRLETTRKEFISGVSHELKTPLSVMKSCISILKDNVASHKKEYYFEAMEKEVDKMDLLIVDMLELAKFESGTYAMKMDVFRIDKSIEAILEPLELSIANKRLRVKTQLAPVEVVANANRIEQVVTNFMTNAIRYTPEDQLVLVSTIEDGGRVAVCVENKGAHIPEEQLDKIWDRFYRADSSRQRSQGGTGLGLAISKNILELHGAEYGAANTDDGVAFYFYLNVNEEDE